MVAPTEPPCNAEPAPRCYNLLLHVQLRTQILALPRQVLFGQNTEVPVPWCPGRRGRAFVPMTVVAAEVVLYMIYGYGSI